MSRVLDVDSFDYLSQEAIRVLDQLSQDPFLAEQIGCVRDELLQKVKELQEQLPTHMAELARVCVGIEQVLAPVRDHIAVIGDFKTRRAARGSYKSIQRTLKKQGRLLIRAQQKAKQWENLVWTSREQTLQNVRTIVSIYLGLPERTPSRGTSEWKFFRAQLVGVSNIRMRQMQLDSSYKNNRFFSSHLEVIAASFPEYELHDELQEKSDRQKGVAELQKMQQGIHEIRERLQLRHPVPPEGADEWEEDREKILGIRAHHLREWGCHALFPGAESAYDSYLEVLADFFAPYRLRRQLLKRRKRPPDEEEKEQKRQAIVTQVKVRVISELGLSCPAAKRPSKRWSEDRKRLLAVRTRDMVNWGFQRHYMGKHRVFESCLEMLILAFNTDYDVETAFTRKSRILTTRKVRQAIDEHYDIPDLAPAKGSPEWERIRAAIIGTPVKRWLFKRGDIAGCFRGDDRAFTSGVDAIVAAYDEAYELREEMEKKRKRYKWRSFRANIARVRRHFSLKYDLPETPPEKHSREWQRIRYQLVSPKWEYFDSRKDIKGVTLCPHPSLKSYFDYMMAAFKPYDLEKWMFSPLGRFFSQRVQENTAEDWEEIDRESSFIRDLLEDGGTEAQEALWTHCAALPVKSSSYIDFDEQRNRAFLLLISNIRMIGIHYPISIAKHWQAVNAYVKRMAEVELIKRPKGLTQGHLESEAVWDSRNHAEQAAEVDLLKEKLDVYGKSTLERFLLGELDIVDPAMQQVVAELQTVLLT